MFHAYADGSSLESMALQATMVMPALHLQKPHFKSKAADHAVHLEHRLQLWVEGKLEELIHEGCTIQEEFKRNQQSQQGDNDQTARLFAKLMMEGKVRTAM